MSERKNLIIYICAFLVGLLLLVFNQSSELLQTIIRIVGTALAVPSLIVGAFTLTNKRQEDNKMKIPTIIACAGCAGLGFAMIFSPGVFVEILKYVFAFVLIATGLQQLILLFIIKKQTPMSMWFYIIPTLVFISGITLAFVTVEQIEVAIALITGIGLTLIGINGIIGHFIHQKIAKALSSAQNAEDFSEFETVD